MHLLYTEFTKIAKKIIKSSKTQKYIAVVVVVIDSSNSSSNSIVVVIVVKYLIVVSDYIEVFFYSRIVAIKIN